MISYREDSYLYYGLNTVISVIILGKLGRERPVACTGETLTSKYQSEVSTEDATEVQKEA
jgi:hypothetical protein